MNNNPIGVLDSGVGGLSIWQEIVRLLPVESTVYIADSKNCPYGNRSEKEIYDLAKRLVQFLLEKECKLIVVACNTITVSCLDRLRQDFKGIPIIGTVPVVKTAVERTRNGKIGILSTPRTALSQYQRDLINRFTQNMRVVNRGTNQLVPLVEQRKLAGAEVEEILQSVLQQFTKEDIDVLALGCSHFPFLKPAMRKILGEHVRILDSGGAIARQVRRVLETEELGAEDHKPKYQFFTTSDKRTLSDFLASIGYNMRAEYVDI